ncbi:MAG: hypothetical protein J5I59_08925 [Saprospiraceae bacterium]|nr:hypothetical protein [Saprospiraceae bacterium]
MRVLFTYIFILCSPWLFGQNGINLFSNAFNAALNNADISSGRIDAGSNNPANMVSGKGLFLSLGTQRSFLIEDINQGNFDVYYRFKNGHAAGLQFYIYGNKVYSEMMTSVAYAVKLKDHTSLGIKFHGLRFSSPENEPEYAFTFTVGAQTMISSQIGVGMVAFNPVGFFRNNNPNDLASDFRLGLSYSPAEYVGLFASGTLSDGYPLSFSGGLAYNIREKLNIYFSVMSNPGVFGLGIGLPLGSSISLNLSGNQHLQLGLSPAVGLFYYNRDKE